MGAVFLILCFIPALLARLIPRSLVPSPSLTVDVPLFLGADKRYVVRVNMSSNPTQNFDFAMTLGTGYSAVAGIECDACGNAPTYNMSASSTASISQDSQAMESIQFFNASIGGTMIQENCALLESNGSVWIYPNQSIIVANQSSDTFSSQVSGIFGLGTNRNLGSFSDTVIGKWFSRNPANRTFTFGMALNSPYRDTTDGGVLHWIAPDPSAYQAPVSWYDAPSTNNTIASDWVISFNGWSSVTGANNVSNSNSSLQAILDPYYPQLYFPQDQARLIYDSIPGSSLQTSGSSLVWTIPCSTKMQLTLALGNRLFSLDQSVLVTSQGSSCVGAIEGWNDSDYLLGSTFISSVYLMFQISNQDTQPSGSIGIAARTLTKKSVSTGVIVGATLGSVAVVVLLGIAVLLAYHFWWIRRAGAKPPSRPPSFAQSTLHILKSAEGDISVPLIQTPPSPPPSTSRVQFVGDSGPPSTYVPGLAPLPSPTGVSMTVQRIEGNLSRNSRSHNSLVSIDLPQPSSAPEIPRQEIVQNFTIDPYNVPLPPNLPRPQKAIPVAPPAHRDNTVLTDRSATLVASPNVEAPRRRPTKWL